MKQGAIVAIPQVVVACTTDMNAARRESGELRVIHAESIGHCGEAKTALSGLAHRADPTSHRLTLADLAREPTIYLIPECDTEEDVHEVLRELCEEIFVEQLAGWFRDTDTWPQDLGFDAFRRWFDFQHHSMLMDLSDEPLIDEPD
jgi:hypothetical protein